MNYTPSEIAAAKADDMGNVQLTVARFIDSRNIKDKMIIGRVVSADGGTIPVLPKYLKPVDVVTFGIRDCLSAEGYSLSPEIPAWDLQSDSIEKRWGTILIGGTIDKLEVVCNKDGIRKNTGRM